MLGSFFIFLDFLDFLAADDGRAAATAPAWSGGVMSVEALPDFDVLREQDFILELRRVVGCEKSIDRV